MAKKVLISLAAVLIVVAGVAALSAYEAHVINVTAKIENALSVSPEEIEFGTVFPQETLYKDLTISLSNSFLAEDRVDDVNYVIKQKPKPYSPEDHEYCLDAWEGAMDDFMDCFTICDGSEEFCWHECKYIIFNYDEDGKCYPPLCWWLSKMPDGTPEPGNDYGVGPFEELIWGISPHGRLAKSEGDIEDTWTIDLIVSCFQGMCAQDYSWEEFGPPLPPELEGQVFGCDLWIEVTGISQKVNLENKDADWNIIPDDGIDGILSYMTTGDSFKGVVTARGLEANKEYQLTINGPGGNVSVGSTDDLIAGSACDAGNMYCGGWWTGSLPVVCQSGGNAGWEGFYTFDLVACNNTTALAVTDGSGNLYYAFDVAMRPGSYSGVKFLIKENFSPWQGKMFEVEPFDFTIY